MAEDGVINGSLKVTLVAAKGLKSVGSAAPSSLVRLRILNSDPLNPKAKPIVSQGQSSEVTSAVRKTTDPVFNQDFKFRIKDVKNARLDVTLWDSDVSITEEAGFLGEVLLNVGKLINYAGTGIQQTFTVRTAPDKNGNTEQNGQFIMILLYDHDRKSGSSQDPVVGCTIKMPQPWSEVKPKRSQYETAILEMILFALKSQESTLNTDPSRIEMVGSERWKTSEGEEKGFMTHFNIHHGKKSKQDLVTCREIADTLVRCAESPAGLAKTGSITELNQGIDIHKPFKKMDPVGQRTPKTKLGSSLPQTVDRGLPLPTPGTSTSAPAADVDTKFNNIDTDKSGTITIDELRAAMKRENPAVTEAQVQRRWAAMDFNKDGSVSRKEFVQAEDFAAIDTDSSGTITIDELRAAMKRENPAVTEAQVIARFTSLDVNRDGSLSKAEYMKAHLDVTARSEDHFLIYGDDVEVTMAEVLEQVKIGRGAHASAMAVSQTAFLSTPPMMQGKDSSFWTPWGHMRMTDKTPVVSMPIPESMQKPIQGTFGGFASNSASATMGVSLKPLACFCTTCGQRLTLIMHSRL